MRFIINWQITMSCTTIFEGDEADSKEDAEARIIANNFNAYEHCDTSKTIILNTKEEKE